MHSFDPKLKQLIKNNPFEKKHIFFVILRFVGPAIMVSMFQALYFFGDQIMIVKFVPRSPNLNPDSIFTSAHDQLNGALTAVNVDRLNIFQIQALQLPSRDHNLYIDYLNAVYRTKGQPLEVIDVVRAAISISVPITIILNGLTVFISMGISVSYGKALARNNPNELQKIWSTGFITNLVIGLATSMAILGFSSVWLSQSASGGISASLSKGSSEDQRIIDRFSVEIFQKLQVKYAQGYIYILSGFNVLQVFVQMYYLLSQSEGRQVFISIVPVIANLVNFLLDWVFIRFTTLGLNGSAVATVIGWLLNFSAYFIFSFIMSIKDKSYLDVRKLRFKLYAWNYFSIIILVGLASLLRNASLALSNALFQTYLVSVTIAVQPSIAGVLVPQNYYQSIFGSIAPITGLALQSIWGVIQGGRVVCAYKYGKKDYDSIKAVYWYVTILSFAYGIIIYFFLVFAIANPLLINLFNVTTGRDLDEANRILRILALRVLFVAAGTTAQLYFQSTQKIVLSWISSTMQGIFIFLPLLFIFNAFALDLSGTQGMNIFLWLPTVNAAIAGIINLLIGAIHMYFFMGKKEKLIEQGLKKPSRWLAVS